MDPPKRKQEVLVWCVDDDGHGIPLMASYAKGYFDLHGVMFWTPVLWMPIPPAPRNMIKRFFEI